MNIYWCNLIDDDCGLFIVAKSRGSAKALFAGIVDEDFTDVRCRIHRKNVDEKNEGDLALGDRRLKNMTCIIGMTTETKFNKE